MNLSGKIKSKYVFLSEKKYLSINLRKKDKINENIFNILKNDTNHHFLQMMITKEKNQESIMYNIDEMVTLSDVIDSNINSDDYLDIIKQIFDFTKLCNKIGISYSDILWDDDYIFFNSSNKKLYFVYFPSENNNLIKFMHSFHRRAETEKLFSFSQEKISALDEPPKTLECKSGAYITDSIGQKYYITHSPFKIGRGSVSENIDLILDVPEISGFHASIISKQGRYFIEDNNSRNGTYMKKSDNIDIFNIQNKISSEELDDGTVFYLYHMPFTFYTDCRSSQTCLVGQSDYESASTMYIGNDDISQEIQDEYIAYISDKNGKPMIYIKNFPFTLPTITGLTLYFDKENCEYSAYISENTDILIDEEETIKDEKYDIFSGCKISYQSEIFYFYVKH